MIGHASPKMAKKLAQHFGGKAQTAKVAMRPSQDAPKFLKKLEQIERKSSRNTLRFN